MIATRCETHWKVGKQTYVTLATRPGPKQEIEIVITLNGQEVQTSRESAKESFGSGICRSVLTRYLRRAKDKGQLQRAGIGLRSKPAKPRLFSK